MKKKLTNQKIENLDKKIAQLQARRNLEMNRLKQRAKKEDTRRKILTGIHYLDRAQKDGTLKKLLKEMDDGWLVRDKDRELIKAAGLLPLVNLRKQDQNRQRILIGAFILEKRDAKKIQADMDKWLTQQRDRKLFELPPLSKAPAAEKSKSKKS
jgi:hypothetical protein